MEMALPRITVVTPSFNQAGYLEQTICSVLDQGYPNLEYVVIDGGSTDRSAEIIKRYEKHLAYWVSEKDRGQAHAINKGLKRSTGSILAYINSDDFFLPGAFERVADVFSGNPSLDLVHGRCRFVDVAGNKTREHFGAIESFEQIVDLWDFWWNKRQFIQPEVFWSRRIMDRIGLLREELFFVMDYEYWTRILGAGGEVGKIDAEIASFRVTPVQKTKRVDELRDELLKVVRELLWDRSRPLSRPRRLGLQAKWLFDSVFLREAHKSVVLGETRMIRWLRLSYLTLQHPKMLLSPRFRTHVSGNASRLANTRRSESVSGDVTW
jgi:glycosyltransferase involved in cell wall biosynthesis